MADHDYAKLAEELENLDLLSSTESLCDLVARAAAALRAAEQDRKDAELFRKLQNMPAKVAQAFFWNHSSRKERAKAIATYDTISEEKPHG